jgi:flagellin
MLQRVRELAVQSASGTYQSSDRDQMQAEVTSLTSQISNVLTNTKFNGNALFNTTVGHGKTFVIQTGASARSDRVTLTSSYIDGNQLVNTLAGGKGLQVATRQAAPAPAPPTPAPRSTTSIRCWVRSPRPTPISARARASCSRPSTT